MEELIFNLIGNLVGPILGGIVGYNTNDENIAFQREANEQNIAFQREINEQNIAFQREANERNIQNQWDMWNATNEYNNPASQMARFKEAGLNPNLIYGQTNTTNPISIPSMGTPSIQAPQIKAPRSNNDAIREMFDKLSKIPVIHEQLKLIKSNSDIASEKAKQEKINTEIAEQYKHDLAKFDWFGKDLDYNVLVQYAKELGLIGDKPNNVLNDIIQAKIDNETMPTKKQKLMDSQIALNNLMHDIKSIDLSNINEFWELKIQAMRLANDVKSIDLDWAEFDKELAASSGLTKILMLLIKSFAR